jgi:superfamily II DNA or RNA helicase
MYGRPEPEDRDHDYVAFTDDAKQQERFRRTLTLLAQKHGYSLKPRPGGFLTASGNNTDLSFYPTTKRDDIHKAWALQESGMSKDDAWAKVDAEKQADLNEDVQLQEHQQRIADRISGEDPRMLVYHGLGSGKSLSAIAAAEAAKQVSGGEYGIAVPASLRGNFQKEIGKFTTGSDPEILSYTGLGDGKQFQNQPDTLIMDEAHRLRNPNAASARAAASQAARAKRLLLLTGSPITNAPSDMANLLSLLHNKQLTPEEFDRRYVGYKTVRPGLLGWLSGAQPGQQAVVKNEDELRKLLAGKVDYQPSKTPEGVNVDEQVIRVPLSAEQQKIQKAIRTKIPPGFLWKLDKEFPLSRDELAKLNSFMTGLRQVSLSTQPFRVDKDHTKAFTQSAKLQSAFKNLQDTLSSDKRKKAIIYSNFVDSGLAPYAAGLEQAKIPHAFFHGGVSPKARQAAVDAYNAGKLRALLIGPAGAEGLSTKGTSLIQLLDPHWHESRSQQARGRGLRFDSHEGLPESLKNVAVQRYLSSSEEPSFLGKILGYQRERTGDEVLERLSGEKEQVNEAFRKLLKEEGLRAALERKNKQEQEQPKTAALSPDFAPDYTPGQLHRMGVYKALYEKEGPRLASQGEWKPEWVTEHDPKGWLQWYQNYNSGRRIPDEDMRQIKRWASFKARHGGPFVKNPTPRRGWALRNWGIDPAKLVTSKSRDGVVNMLSQYREQELKKYLRRRFPGRVVPTQNTAGPEQAESVKYSATPTPHVIHSILD